MGYVCTCVCEYVSVNVDGNFNFRRSKFLEADAKSLDETLKTYTIYIQSCSLMLKFF